MVKQLFSLFLHIYRYIHTYMHTLYLYHLYLCSIYSMENNLSIYTYAMSISSLYIVIGIDTDDL